MTTQTKIAFITGAKRGIGLETARGLGKLDITVLLGSRDAARGEQAAEGLRREGVARAESVAFDVVNREHHRRVAALIEERFGRLDILVNNAGVLREQGDFAAPGGFNTTSTVSD